MKYLIGYDIGSSSVKASLSRVDTGEVVARASSPLDEMEIISVKPGFAEQDPENWWLELVHTTRQIRVANPFAADDIAAIGISYQMHGLVCIDRDLNPLRPAIIWCDSRAVSIGDKAFEELGVQFCLENFLNSPGNFTASKLKWVQENEPHVYNKIYKILLPGDFIALRLTNEPRTTVSGLSEGIFWNYQSKSVARELLQYYSIDENILPGLVPTFGEQGLVSQQAAQLLGIKTGTPVCYRAGDQLNNAYSLKVLSPGEVAATAGTSAVVYGVTDKRAYDKQSRVNSFVHVSQKEGEERLGVLLCINGAGILNSWLRKCVFAGWSYQQIDDAAARVPIGSEGLRFFPFGNGAERILGNRNLTARLQGLQFNTHGSAHVARAAQEGIVFSLNFGMEIMAKIGGRFQTIRAGYANMFLSEVFARTFSDLSGCMVELYDTNGANGAARAAGVGAGLYKNFSESYVGISKIKDIEPDLRTRPATQEAYLHWKEQLLSFIN